MELRCTRVADIPPGPACAIRTCEHGARRVIRTEYDGPRCSSASSRSSVSVLALKVGEFDGGELAVDTAHFAFDVLPFSAYLARYLSDVETGHR
jgi:hypothetical protein